METHPSGSDFELYVIGALPPDRVALLEGHVLACAACAERLEREARLETALWEVAESLRDAPALAPLGDLARGGAEVHPLGAAARRRDSRLARARALLGRAEVRLAVAGVAAAAGVAVIALPSWNGGPGAGPSQVASRGELPSPGVQLVAGPSEPSGRPPRHRPVRRLACAHLDGGDCDAEDRLRSRYVVSGTTLEEMTRYELLTGHRHSPSFSTAGWQR